MHDGDVLRYRVPDDDAYAPDEGAGGSVSFIGKTTAVGTYPTTARAYYAVFPCDLTGDETEGTAVGLSGAKDPVYAANVGNAIPPSGTVVVVTRAGNRSAFQYG